MTSGFELTSTTFRLLCALGFVIRIAFIGTTIGTTDVVLNIAWLEAAQRYGVAGAYAHYGLLNHPPLSLLVMLGEDVVGRALHVAYTDVFRFVQVCADALTAFSLYRIGRVAGIGEARRLTLFIVLSPAAAFISGFHCNTDPMMVALTMFAASFIVVPPIRPALAGVILACAANIKILPLLLVGFFLLPLSNRHRLIFSIAFLVTFGALLAPFVVAGGPIVILNIFGYSGMDRDWGFPQLARFQSIPVVAIAARIVAHYARLIIIAAVLGLLLVTARAWRRTGARTVPLAASGAMFLVLLFFAPGFGVQYLDWPLALLPFALSWRTAIGLNATMSLFLFITYTVWCDGWPWWYADLAVPHRYLWLVTASGLVTWLAIGFGAVEAVVRLTRRQSPVTE